MLQMLSGHCAHGTAFQSEPLKSCISSMGCLHHAHISTGLRSRMKSGIIAPLVSERHSRIEALRSLGMEALGVFRVLAPDDGGMLVREHAVHALAPA
jgi:hypothetical protein